VIALLLVILAAALQDINLWISLVAFSCFICLVCWWMWISGKDSAAVTFGLGSCRLHWIITGALLGILLSVALRWDHGRSLVPTTFTWFLPIAASIGLSEELAFRGYILGRFQSWLGWMPAILLSACAHSGYKVALFFGTSSVNLLYLGSLTFAAGILLGCLRHWSQALWPCIAFHVMFDVWVYGDASTPWWIW
jgi:membrane protease YdiL (CAAX protease family)